MAVCPPRARLHSRAQEHSSSPSLPVPLPGLLPVVLERFRTRAVCLWGGFIILVLFSLLFPPLHLQFTFPQQRGLLTAPPKRVAKGLSAHVTHRKT